MIDWLNN